jgi:hypothetical protein
MPWVIEVAVAGLAEVKRGVAVLIPEVGVGTMFE